jgi:outer membrane scaffolding protein for murein synthesis (MipA/OmpV family)
MRDAARMTPETIVGFVALSVAASLFATAAHGQALQDLAVEQQGLNERPAPGAFANLKDLTGQAGDSPIVERRTEYVIGLGAAYHF